MYLFSISLIPYISQTLISHTIKQQLHPRNIHQGTYDFEQLIQHDATLSPFVQYRPDSEPTINFFDPTAVKALNRALLRRHYAINFWDIPPNYLCPPIPGRADYIHYLADLLSSQTATADLPYGNQIRILDIGTGANMIYPILGHRLYQWSFVGTDINSTALDNAQQIVDRNDTLSTIELRQQPNPKRFFETVIHPGESFAAVMCNPPFYDSAKAAKQATRRKLQHLTKQMQVEDKRNFGGQPNELWCKGGELRFIKRLARASTAYAKQVEWFTVLVAQQKHLTGIQAVLKEINATRIKVIAMAQGNKQSRIIAWQW